MAGSPRSPTRAGDWWRLHLESWHPLALGTDVPAPPYVASLALLGSLLGTTWTVSALLVLAVPSRCGAPGGSCGWSGDSSARRVRRDGCCCGAPRRTPWCRWRPAPGVTDGSDRSSSGALLPWLAHAALGFADPDPDRRWRAAWRTGLLLALVAAFTPVAWLFGLTLGLIVLVAALAHPAGRRRGPLGVGTARDRGRRGAGAARPLVAARSAQRRGCGADPRHRQAARPRRSTPSTCSPAGSAGWGRPGGWASCSRCSRWRALVPTATRIPVLVCWMAAAVAGVLAAVLGNVTLSLTATETQAGLGFLVVALQACFVTAVVIAGQRLDLAPRRGPAPRPGDRGGRGGGGGPAGRPRLVDLRHRRGTAWTMPSPASRPTWCSARRPARSTASWSCAATSSTA